MLKFTVAMASRRAGALSFSGSRIARVVLPPSLAPANARSFSFSAILLANPSKSTTTRDSNTSTSNNLEEKKKDHLKLKDTLPELVLFQNERYSLCRCCFGNYHMYLYTYLHIIHMYIHLSANCRLFCVRRVFISPSDRRGPIELRGLSTSTTEVNFPLV